MSRIKNELKSSLTTDNLENLMKINLIVEDITKFNPDIYMYLIYWMNTNNVRNIKL